MKIKCINSNKVGFFIPLCWDDAILSYANTVGQNYVRMYANAWEFNYVPNNINLGNGIDGYFDIYMHLDRNCNINLKDIKVDDFEHLLEVINTNLDNNIPTIIHIDSYYCDWTPLYKKVHTKHVMLVCDNCSNKKKIALVDPGFREQEIVVEYEVIKRACHFYLEISQINRTYKTASEIILEDIRNNELVNDMMFSNIIKFGNDFRASFDYKLEFNSPYEANEVYQSNIMEQLRHVIKGRNSFILFIEEVATELEIDINPITESLYVAVSKWLNVLNLLVKEAFHKWRDHEFSIKISNIIYEIADIEMDTYHKIKNLINGNVSNRMFSEVKDKSYISTNLSLFTYFNNKAIARSNEDEVADLTNMGEFFILSNQYSDGYIFINNVNFKIELENKYDNIVCEGQVIHNDTGKHYKGIGILCCTEWTNYNREIIKWINFDDEVTNIFVRADDISNMEANHVIDIGSTYTRVENNVVRENNAMTYIIQYFEKEQTLEQLELPYSNNLHIFSIVLLE